MILLVGDNPFHGISHLSQERARARGEALSHTGYAAELVVASLENGAEGFMFSASETTLSILENVCGKLGCNKLPLYVLVPYAYEYVRLATQAGGIPGLAKKFAKKILFSGNLTAAVAGINGVLRSNPEALLKAYLDYELSRIKSSGGRQAELRSVLLHEIVTDTALALDLKWLFEFYADFMLDRGVKPGYNTRNFPYLVNKFREWHMKCDDVVFAAPFNKVGFQMTPSKEKCEKSLTDVGETEIIAISILAAGYLKPQEAMDYVAGLPNISGVAVGVSKERHARETFKLLRGYLEGVCRE